MVDHGVGKSVQQPTILVKKPDGTFVRVPLSELKKKPVVSVPVVTPQVVVEKKFEPIVVAITDVSSEPRGIASSPDASRDPRNDKGDALRNDKVTTPVVVPVPASIPEPQGIASSRASAPRNDKINILRNDRVNKVKPLAREDFQSPLEDKTVEKSLSAVSSAREDQVGAVMKKLSFLVEKNLENRLRSLIQLRLKDVRGSEQTKEVAMKESKNGGLNLSEAQAGEIEVKCQNVLNKSLPMIEKEELPMSYKEPAVPSRETPFNSFVTPPEPPLGKRGMVSGAMNVSTTSSSSVPPVKKEIVEEILNLNSQPIVSVKQSMRDITPPQTETGPIEEIKYFTLTDFRRLSNNPHESARRLKQKFFNLRDESYVLYFDALAAWKKSPLYLEYIRAVCASLSQRKPLAQILSDKNKIQMIEVEAVVEMEREL